MSLREDIEEYADEFLPSDPLDWCRRHSTKKIIHDALWGTFELAPHEVALLDTSLLQRLRFLHQTGAVHLTYPSARHTRFEHVLGVMYQAGRVCSALRNRGQGSFYGQDIRFDHRTEQQARFTALIHDIGHGPFSHTSEQYYSAYKDMIEAKQDSFFHDSGAGEVLSCLLVRTEKFRRFIAAVNNVYSLKIDADDSAKMITGNMNDENMYLSEIVHGPFDADKLDYMHRDGMFSGLKMHVDLDRLYASINVLTATVDDAGYPQTMTRLAGSMAGTSPLSQIMFNKMLLFTGIYHHHKVRAVDCMLWAIFELAKDREAKIGGRHIKGTVDFLRLTDDRVLTEELTDDADIRKIIADIRNRRLWRRALVISRHTVQDSMHDPTSTIGDSPFFEIVKLSGNSPVKIEKRREIARKIWKKATPSCEPHEVWFDVPKLPSMEEAERMWIATENAQKPVVTLGDFLPIREWVELYGTHKWQAHVFCPAPAREKINKAARQVLEGEFGLRVTEMATIQAHIDRM